MLDTLYRWMTNAIYLTPLWVKRFKNKNPATTVLVASAVKALKFDKDSEVRYEPRWIAAKRAVLILTTDRLVCGSWEIPLANIKNATLLRVKALAAKALILKVGTNNGEYYQFGMQYDPAWEEQMALKVAVEDSQIDYTVKDGKIQYSTFSVIVRAILIIWIIWSVIQWIQSCGS